MIGFRKSGLAALYICEWKITNVEDDAQYPGKRIESKTSKVNASTIIVFPYGERIPVCFRHTRTAYLSGRLGGLALLARLSFVHTLTFYDKQFFSSPGFLCKRRHWVWSSALQICPAALKIAMYQQTSR